MMEYRVILPIVNLEFDFALEIGDRFQDGDCEPDLIAQWLSQGFIEAVNLPKPKAKDWADVTYPSDAKGK
jgi:hypothetical protein